MRVHINSFTGGEIAPYLEGRTDLPNLARGCRLLRNMLPRSTGGAWRRHGMMYKWTTKHQGRECCLLPFNFSDLDSFVLELGHEYIRFGKNGALIQSGGSAYEVAAEWQESELFDIKYVQVNDVMWGAHTARSPFQLVREADDNWTLQSVQSLISAGGEGALNAWPPMLDANVTQTTLACDHTAVGTAELTASAALFDAEHVGSLWEISHRRDAAFSELTIPVFPPASEVMTITGLPVAGQTFTINGRPYTWRAVADAPYDVLIPATPDLVGTHMIAAINATSGSTFYGPGTAPHQNVVASDGGETTSAASATGVLTSSGSNNLLKTGVTIGTGGDARSYYFATQYDPYWGNSAVNCFVKIGATVTDTLLNLLKAINLSGVGDGTDYQNNNGNMTIHPTVSASVQSPNSLLLTAKTGGTAGNSIPTTVALFYAAGLSFGAATLTGVTAGVSYKVLVEARDVGVAGNSISVAENMDNASWKAGTAGFLTGGTDIDKESAGFTVLGSYKIWSYGLWKGTVVLERRVTEAVGDVQAVYEVLRQWRGNNDRNIVEQGTAESPETLRLRVIDGSGSASADVDIPRFVIEADDVRIYGLVEIAAVTSSTVAQVNIVRPLHSTDATTLWSEGAWSDYRGWPNGVAIHEQRLLFMGTAHEPERVWASASADFLNFRRGTAEANAWSRVLAADEASLIAWGASVGGGLVIGKPKEEWLVTSGDPAASISPTTFQAKEQSQFGAADIQPLKVGARLLFAQEGARSLLEYGFDWQAQSFEAVDLAELALHFTRGGIKQMDFAKKPDDVVWIVTDDGKLLSMTYKRRQEGSVIAWAYHPTSGTVESVAVINGANGLDDVYVAVQRTINGATVRFVEKLDSYTGLALEKCNDLYVAWLADPTDANWDAYLAERVLLTYLDSSVRATSVSPTTTFAGFSHLNGTLVNVQADGSEHDPVLVSGGSITLTRSASTALAGLPYTSQLQPTPFDVQLGDGTSIGKKWKVSDLAIRFYLTGNAQYADDPVTATKWTVALRDASDDANAPIALHTGIKKLAITGTYNDSVSVWIGTSGAEPLAVLGITPSFTIHSN